MALNSFNLSKRANPFSHVRATIALHALLHIYLSFPSMNGYFFSNTLRAIYFHFTQECRNHGQPSWTGDPIHKEQRWTTKIPKIWWRQATDTFWNTNLRHKELERELSHSRPISGKQDFTISLNQDTWVLSQLKATLRSNPGWFYLHKS